MVPKSVSPTTMLSLLLLITWLLALSLQLLFPLLLLAEGSIGCISTVSVLWSAMTEEVDFLAES